LKSKLDELKSLTKSLILRVREVDLRPQKIQELKEALNLTEINSLDKLIKETYVSKWNGVFLR
jgi:hypothetical protein